MDYSTPPHGAETHLPERLMCDEKTIDGGEKPGGRDFVSTASRFATSGSVQSRVMNAAGSLDRRDVTYRVMPVRSSFHFRGFTCIETINSDLPHAHVGVGGSVAGTRRDRMVMEPVSVESAIEKAKKKGLRPGRVKGTHGIQFTKGRTKRIEVIGWDEFRKTLKERKLQVYESGGSIKIMKRRRRRP